MPLPRVCSLQQILFLRSVACLNKFVCNAFNNVTDAHNLKTSRLPLPGIQGEVRTILKFRIDNHNAPIPYLDRRTNGGSDNPLEYPFRYSPVNINPELLVQGNMHGFALRWISPRSHCISPLKCIKDTDSCSAKNGDTPERYHPISKRVHGVVATRAHTKALVWLLPVRIRRHNKRIGLQCYHLLQIRFCVFRERACEPLPSGAGTLR